MSSSAARPPFIAIACGGTGGHLFPGLAIGAELKKRGCDVALLISPKDVDQQAVNSASGMEIFTLPAVALQNRNYFSFARSCWQSWRAAKKTFSARPPQAVLAMGGFTSAPPVIAARKFGAKTFLHESNTIPGKANRLLARFVDEAFVGFPEAAARLKARKVSVTGTPVRPQFSGWWGERPGEPALARRSEAATARGDARPTKIYESRIALGLEPDRPTVLVMGGSQGASGLNEMVLSALPLLKVGVQASACSNQGTLKHELQQNMDKLPALQFLHLTGASDFEQVKAGYVAQKIKSVVKPFLAEMDLALGAATACVSRSGASSLAEIAAMRLPSLLVPFPAAADNHQLFNASAFEKTGAAKLLEQKDATPEKVAAILSELVGDEAARTKIQAALAQWHAPKAAEQIAESILASIKVAQVSRLPGERVSASISSTSPDAGGKPALLCEGKL
jgi:UDP-N-acetylglucosamine--N-acetylmuramyl-(pentapeptide) pyrophosphoryl-undecaprenol N-acetylglucosamine transferase